MGLQRSGQAAEIQRPLTCDSLGKNVTSRQSGWKDDAFSLYGAQGARKYLNRSERNRALTAIRSLQHSHSLFALVLAFTGARVSEVLALTHRSFQIEQGLVTIVTAKRRKHSVREVPIPRGLMVSLNRFFLLRTFQREGGEPERLWPFCRMTAYRIIRRVMKRAQVCGAQACPRGLRHAFGVACTQSGVPITLVQKWLGHSRLSTTAIYLNVSGPEEISFARRMWKASGEAIRERSTRSVQSL